MAKIARRGKPQKLSFGVVYSVKQIKKKFNNEYYEC